MGIHKKSGYFKCSLVSPLLFVVSLYVVGNLIRNAIKLNHPTSMLVAVSWLALLWVSLFGLFLYRSTTAKQSIVRHILVFALTPVVLSPILAIVYFLLVLSPLYNLVSSSGFSG